MAIPGADYSGTRYDGALAVVASVMPAQHGQDEIVYDGTLALFIAAGLVLLGLAIRATAEAMRFRGTSIELQSGVLGERRLALRAGVWGPDAAVDH